MSTMKNSKDPRATSTPSSGPLSRYASIAGGTGLLVAFAVFSFQGWAGSNRSLGAAMDSPLGKLIGVALIAIIAAGIGLAIGSKSRAPRREARATAGSDSADATNATNATFRALVDQAPDGIVLIDAALQIRLVNRAFVAMTGIPAEECVGQTFGTLEARLQQAGDPTQQSNAELSAALRTSPEAQAIIPARNRRLFLTVPTSRALEWSVLPKLNDGTGPASMRAIMFRNVTNHVEVEQMKAEFLSVAAHELRTPLSSILGFSEILGKGGLPEPEQREFAELIAVESRRLADILDDLLDLTRIDASGIRAFHFRELPLVPLIESTVAQTKLPSDKYKLAVEIEPNAQWWIRADRNKLEQVLGNLLSNAIKYSPNGGEIKITVSWRKRDGKNLAEIAIIDQGIGMTPAQVTRAFDRFFRADTNGRVQGTGLGLSLVKEIVSRHGGEVLLESRKDAGTRMRILMPASPRKTVASEAVAG